MLPKIHKVNNPGRPVVSSVISHTEKFPAYVDEFLRPIAEKLPSYMQDNTHFIKRIRTLGNCKLPEKCYLATLDVSSLYTNIDTDEGLTIVEEELGKTNQNRPSSKTLSCLLEKVLKLNNFTFGNEHYIQVGREVSRCRGCPLCCSSWWLVLYIRITSCTFPPWTEMSKNNELWTMNYEQIKGTAMGTGVAPNFANVDMGRLEERFVYQTEWANHIII